MMRIILAATLAFTSSAFGAEKPKEPNVTEDVSPVPQARVTTDPTGTHIYVKTPVHWFFDDNQKTDAVMQIKSLIESKLSKLKAVNVADPDGDLQSLKDSLDALKKQVDLLVQTAGQLNNQLKKSRLYAVDPTGLIVFAGVELEQNFAKVLFAGGSFMLGVSIVPLQVETYRTDTRQKVGPPTWDYDVSFIAIPTVNIGVGTSNTGAVRGQMRGGIGLVFDTLNSASDIVGVSIGPSVTGQVRVLSKQVGLNIKFVTLKNFSKPGVFNNEMLLVGVEPQNANPATNLSLFGWDVEAHIAVSPIIDPTPLLKKLMNFASP